jgi:hypothetical protein
MEGSVMSAANTPPHEIDLQSVTSDIENARTVFEMAEVNGRAQIALAERLVDLKSAVCDGASTVGAAVNSGAECLKSAIHEVQCAVEKIPAKMTENIDCLKSAIHEVRCAVDSLTCEVGKLSPSVSQIAEHLCQLPIEIRSLKDCAHIDLTCICDTIRPFCERARFADLSYEQIRIIASENVNVEWRPQFEILGRMADEAIRSEKLGDFFEHMQRWQDPPPAPTGQLRRK